MDKEKALHKRIGRRISRLRAKLDLSQRELAARAGLTAAGVSLIERGRCGVRIWTIHRLAKALRVPVKELV